MVVSLAAVWTVGLMIANEYYESKNDDGYRDTAPPEYDDSTQQRIDNLEADLEAANAAKEAENAQHQFELALIAIGLEVESDVRELLEEATFCLQYQCSTHVADQNIRQLLVLESTLGRECRSLAETMLGDGDSEYARNACYDFTYMLYDVEILYALEEKYDYLGRP